MNRSMHCFLSADKDEVEISFGEIGFWFFWILVLSLLALQECN